MDHGGGTDALRDADGRIVGLDQADVSATGKKGTPTERSADCAGGDPLGAVGPRFRPVAGALSCETQFVCEDRYKPTHGGT